MISYQLAVLLILVVIILSVLVIGLIESIIKRHKAKKDAFAELERENKMLKNQLYAIKYRAKLKGVDLDV